MSIVSLVHSAKFIVVLYRLHLVLYRLCCVGCIKQRVSPLVQVHFSGIVSVSFDRVRRKGLEESLYQFLSNIKCNI